MELSKIQPYLITYLNHLGPKNDTPRMAQVFDALLALADRKLAMPFQHKQETENVMGLLGQYRMMSRWAAASRSIAEGVREYETVQNERKSGIGLLEPEAGGIPELAEQVALEQGLPPKWFRRLIQLESGFDPNAKSSRGAMGLGQMMPETAKEWGLRVASDRKEGSVWHPRSNLEASAKYLRWLHGLYRDLGVEGPETWKFTAGAYNAGVGNIGKAIRLLPGYEELKWSRMKTFLPQVTGSHAAETLNYVNRLYT
jgi:soluble lytic murein transglycosylase-like protein